MAEKIAWNEELAEAMGFLEKGQPKVCLAALHALLQDHGTNSLCRALVFDGMGRALFADNEPALGIEAFTESLKIVRQLYEEKKISAELLQQALQNLAHAQLMTGKMEEATRLGNEALELAKKNFGEESTQTAEALFHLSAAYYDKKEYDDAEKLLLQAKKILENLSDSVQPLIGTILNNLGRIYEERGQTDHGISYHRRAVEFRRTLENKEDLAFSLGNYGVALGSNGELEKACEALHESVVIYTALGMDQTPEAKAFAANLELFEKALHKNLKGGDNE